MERILIRSVGLLLVITIGLGCFIKKKVTLISLEYPTSWEKPSYDFSKNPLSEEGFQLGRTLFYDPNLSVDSTISCASCHLQYTAFTHVDHDVSHGIEGKKGTRNSPVLINLAWNTYFHWDGGVTNLDLQGINPIEHPAEMGNTLVKVLSQLNNDKEYQRIFKKVFGEKTITSNQLLRALSQYTISLVSANSKYDQVKKGTATFTVQEQKGYELFLNNCNACHTEPLFTSKQFASNGLPINPEYNDLGRYSITQQGKDSLLFKIPTLRNIQFSFPYMHDGRYKKLNEVMRFYGEEINPNSPNLSAELKHNFTLSSNEQKDIIAFLYTLTDKEFLYNPRFRYPLKK